MPTHFFSLMNFCISLLGCPLPPSTKSSQTNFLSVAKRWLANTIPLLAWTLHSFRMLFVYQKDPAMLCACVVTFSFFEWFQRVVSADPSALSEAVQGITQVWPLTQFHSGCLFLCKWITPLLFSFLPSSNSLSLQYRTEPSWEFSSQPGANQWPSTYLLYKDPCLWKTNRRNTIELLTRPWNT